MAYKKIPKKFQERALTQAQEIEQISDRLVDILKEWLDGFIVLGFTRDKSFPILLQQSDDVKTHMALNDMFIRNFVKMKDQEYGEEPYTLFTDE